MLAFSAVLKVMQLSTLTPGGVLKLVCAVAGHMKVMVVMVVSDGGETVSDFYPTVQC